MRTRLAAVVGLAVLMAIAALLAPSASAESSSSAFGGRLVTLINQARAQHGLKALTVTSGTSTVATSWTQHLDQQQALSHNPDLGHQLETHGSPNWTAYGENVGDGPTSSADTLFQAYMNSPEHRANILGSAYRYLGIGVVFDGSTAWNTLDFVDQYSTPKTTTTTTTTATTTTSSPTQHSARRVAKVAPKPAARPVAAVHHAVSRPVARPQAKPVRPAHVRAIASAAPAATPAAPAAEPATRVAVELPAPVALPHGGRDTAPILAAAAAILLVVATRYVVEVFPPTA
jgi:hypothetical protein